MWGVEVLAREVLTRLCVLQPNAHGCLLLHTTQNRTDVYLSSIDQLHDLIQSGISIVLVVLYTPSWDLHRLLQLLMTHEIIYVLIDATSHMPINFPSSLEPLTALHLRQTHTFVYSSFAIDSTLHQWLLRPLEDPVHVYGSIVAQDIIKYGQALASIPLQLALVVLRLLHYSPSIFLQYLDLFAKKIPNLNTPRLRFNVHTELMRVYQWPQVPDAIANFLNDPTIFTINDKNYSQTPLLFADAPASIEGFTTVSTSPVWNAQKSFYKQHGMSAWSSNIVPYGVSSSMFIAEAYARVVLQFFIDCHATNNLPMSPINCYVLEGGSGCCKFGLAFARHLLGLIAQLDLHEVIRPCIVLTDLSLDVLVSRRNHADFQSLMTAFPGQLDFAVLDVEEVIATKAPLQLLVAQTSLDLSSSTPLFLIGNYFFDSLPADIFLVEPSGLSPVLTDEHGDGFAPSPMPVQDITKHYESQVLNATLSSVQKSLRVSLLLFPVQALRFLSVILPQNAPFGLLLGDAVVHTTDTFHHVPELSPHADCFCLPVDLSLLDIFLNQAFSNVKFQSTLQIFADTFQVCFATRYPNPSESLSSHVVFEAELQSFGANDCDLIMGTIQSTPQAFSTLEPQLALLALSKWDFDCFLVFMWPMARQLHREPSLQASVHEVGIKCFDNHYLLNDTKSFNLHLNMARWLYAIGAYEDAGSILKDLVSSHDIRVLYLLGLICCHLNLLDKALTLFKACLNVKPLAKLMRAFRSPLLNELVQSNEAAAWTPEEAMELLVHLFPSSPLIADLVENVSSFVFRQENEVSVAYKQLYHGMQQYVDDQSDALDQTLAQLSEKQTQNEELDAEIAYLEAQKRAHQASFNEKACKKEIAMYKRRRDLRARQSASVMKEIDETQDTLMHHERLAKDESKRMRHEDLTYRINLRKLKDQEGMLGRFPQENDSKQMIRTAEYCAIELKQQIESLQQNIANCTPQIHALTTEIFAVRASRAELEKKLANVSELIEEIQNRVLDYKQVHTPRPNWDQVIAQVDATFKSHSRKCPNQKITCENLLKLHSSSDRVMYLAHAVQVIGLADDAGILLTTYFICNIACIMTIARLQRFRAVFRPLHRSIPLTSSTLNPARFFSSNDEKKASPDDLLLKLLKPATEKSNATLLDACANGYEDIVASLVHKPGIDINGRGEDSTTPLMRACINGDKRIIQMLLKHPDIDVNMATKEGITALMMATKCGQYDAISLLLQHATLDVNQKNELGSTALHLACHEGDLPITELLLVHPKIDINAKDNDGYSVLLYACLQEHANVLELLLKHPQIDVNLEMTEGVTPLVLAAARGQYFVVDRLLEHPNIDMKSPVAAEIALTKGFNDIVELFIDNSNWDVTMPLDESGHSLLHIAVHQGVASIVLKLLGYSDTQVNLPAYDGTTPLMVACFAESEAMTKLLLQDPRVDVNSQRDDGATPLIAAVNMENINLVQMLLEHPSIDVNLEMQPGVSALTVASSRSLVEIVQLILAHKGTKVSSQ
ncbi:ankyrin repeat domain-containing protein 50 [Thraustotheca clavata]|uniref:Ankyrin repeat domain-containing protein 50 n=1 Tax=Thraustotheca clavata TaxID=74557 RepID=A0A1V9ZV73_9STRA|nr:ankyrin repeat domain-containing protein 50 [Thraustotheca clavata]